MTISEQQKKSLEYFIGKVVTMLAPPINRNLDDSGVLSYFLGKVTKIDEAGLWFKNIDTNCENFIFYNKLISIAEEVVVLEDKKEAEIIKAKVLPKTIQDLQDIIS